MIIKKESSPIVVDHFFCTDCEIKLSQFENEYAKTLTNNESDSKIASEIALLFWITVIWRVSIFRKQGLILQPKEEEKLRRILDRRMGIKINDFNSQKAKDDDELKGLCYRLIRCPCYSENAATYLFCHPNHTRPYSLIIGKYILFFYFKKGHVDNLVQSFFGLENHIKKSHINTVESGERKIILNEKDFKSALDKLIELIADIRNTNYNWLFDEAHKKFGGKGDIMPSELKQAIMNNLNNKEKKLGRKQTFEDLIKSMYEEMKKIMK